MELSVWRRSVPLLGSVVNILAFFLLFEHAHTTSARGVESWCAGTRAYVTFEKTPIYADADLRSKVIRHVNPSDPLCEIGVVKGFTMIQLEAPQLVDGRETSIAYLRERDVISAHTPSRNSAQGGFERLKSFLQAVQSGMVIEDPLAPFRPLIGPYEPPEIPMPTEEESTDRSQTQDKIERERPGSD